MAQKKGAAKKQKTAQEAAEMAALANRPTRHYCASAQCPTPREHILQKDLLPAGLPKGPMKMFHKTCWRKI
jgi:hypothetical protein